MNSVYFINNNLYLDIFIDNENTFYLFIFVNDISDLFKKQYC